ncbi:pyridoxamine 5'-phosphate oxidase family protein [Cryobacterium sp. TMT1-3]|uniref:Pyridoxamine 5'-phosphate oxidase family protein n=1 Tax=Cryobacterium luteum TaxID=1424661 RepID=A0A1H8KTE5_9MICO|nr:MULTISPECIES: pyridoxamine 5'-phosphate oxidase family protein [Cryobacterium]TFB87803.1 pyridoxamine 5'-phosphate oxidase family protein [Cryobacterium luteum]TFC30585.1 pyridoxamine 5'-phosphate oxidase family protein [Cryobacterium sp. TMT1-3]SEN96091.1 Nitroimidazol reductase NimA, pyridoxamine 5'-phosphate oxidase superfamily [Cryobacterium luteum]
MTFDDVNAASVPVQILSEDECWNALLSASLGRVAVAVGGIPDIFPVNFVAADRRLLFRTASGTKLIELTVNNRVAFETDGVGRDDAWSVVVHGTARALQTQREIDDAAALPLRPLIPTVKPVFVEIVPESVTGRRFTLGPEPTATLT